MAFPTTAHAYTVSLEASRSERVRFRGPRVRGQ
jgi:hypothetical protein